MRTRVGLLLCGLLISACGGSPTKPDPRIPPATGTPTSLVLFDYRFDFPGATTTLRAETAWGTLYFTSRDVTVESEWASSNPQVVRVAGPGRVTSISPGEALVSVTFNGLTKSLPVRIFAGEPPLPLSPGELVGRVVDDAGSGASGATWSVIDGHNAGITATTDASGFFRLQASWICGPTTVRASKPGYKEATGAWTLCVDRMPSLILIPAESRGFPGS